MWSRACYLPILDSQIKYLQRNKSNKLQKLCILIYRLFQLTNLLIRDIWATQRCNNSQFLLLTIFNLITKPEDIKIHFLVKGEDRRRHFKAMEYNFLKNYIPDRWVSFKFSLLFGRTRSSNTHQLAFENTNDQKCDNPN